MALLAPMAIEFGLKMSLEPLAPAIARAAGAELFFMPMPLKLKDAGVMEKVGVPVPTFALVSAILPGSSAVPSMNCRPDASGLAVDGAKAILILYARVGVSDRAEYLLRLTLKLVVLFLIISIVVGLKLRLVALAPAMAIASVDDAADIIRPLKLVGLGVVENVGVVVLALPNAMLLGSDVVPSLNCSADACELSVAGAKAILIA